jgi:hypothetical protein
MGPHPGKSSKTLVLVAVSILQTLACASAAEVSGHIPWATGRQLSQTLAQPIDVFWSNNPLRDAMTSLSRAQRVAILIDRRVDPGQRLTLNLQNVPLETILQTVAERCGLGLARLGPVVYLAPPPAAERLRPLAAAMDRAARQLPADRRPLSAGHAASTSSATQPAPSLERVRIQRLSVRAKPLGPVLRQLAERLGLQLKIDEQAIQRAGISLDQQVSVLVENATVDQLLHELLKSTGLKFQRRQNVVEILPAD